MMGAERQPVDAERFEQLVQQELSRRSTSALHWLSYDLVWYVGRFVIRSLRIAAGCGMAFVGIFFLAPWAIDKLGRPFAELSPLDLIFGLIAGLFAIGITLGAFGVAFGEGEQRSVYDEKAREMAEREAVEAFLRKGLADGGNSIAIPRRWPSWAIVLAVGLGYLLLLGLIAILG